MDYDAPVTENLPGSPDALREAARRLRAASATAGEEAVRQVRSAHDTASAGWHGPAGSAFGNACRHAGARVDGMVEKPPRAAPALLGYADTLQRLQAEYRRVQQEWVQAVRAVAPMLPDDPELPMFEAQRLAAQAELDRIVAEALRANTAAADTVRAVQAEVDVPKTVAQRLLTGATYTVALRFAGDEVQADKIGDVAGGTVARWAGRALAPVGSGIGQALEDTANPDYSVAERIGRAVTMGVVNGVPTAVAGSAAGFAAAETGPLGSFAAAAAAGAIVSAGIHAIPLEDDAVDLGGEVFDRAWDQL